MRNNLGWVVNHAGMKLVSGKVPSQNRELAEFLSNGENQEAAE